MNRLFRGLLMLGLAALGVAASPGVASSHPERPRPRATERTPGGVIAIAASGHGPHSAFRAADGELEIQAGILSRKLHWKDHNLTTTALAVNGRDCLVRPAREFSLSVAFAEPNRRPKGLTETTTALETTAHFSGTDTLNVSGGTNGFTGGVSWGGELAIVANAWSDHFTVANVQAPKQARDSGRSTVKLEARAKSSSPLKGMEIRLYYEVYEGYPVIRKWAEVANQGRRWIKLSQFMLDDFELSPGFRNATPLTPGERGAGPSVIAFESSDAQAGFIAVSEIPSALRQTRDTGAMGYSTELFEWVLGPGETFASEPVFLLGYAGETVRTISALCTPRDRAVEGVYMRFLKQHIGVAADKVDIKAPQWCSWSNFGTALTDKIVREQAALAARCGFQLVLLDSGWQKDALGTEADPKKFPKFEDTCRYLDRLGLKLGLWVSCFRTVDSDLYRPEFRSLPLIKRDGGFGMSFASDWKDMYARDLARLSRKYGAVYFKQDFTNLKFGDIAEGHESRTQKESLLRGLRGLLEAQDRLRKLAPEVTAELTHEIYWGTPGVPCDVAALKHAAAYHIPPNDYAGVGHNKQRVNDGWQYDPLKLRRQLIDGCFNARQRFFAHRGLPLYALEYYAAQCVNFRGSLTPEVQDRQVCSWLLGAPTVFAGDLAGLSEENIQRYQSRFAALTRLENAYGIYRHFQFSGVPAPTDSDWHWWGKLNQQGAGVVVVIRGSGGVEQRAINIPWVAAETKYELRTVLTEKALGRFRGSDLQQGKVELALAPYGQEILELKPVP